MSASGADEFVVTRRQVLHGLVAGLGVSMLPACGWFGEDHPALPEVRVRLGSVARRYFNGDLEAAQRLGESWVSRFDDVEAVREDLEQTFAPLAGIRSTQSVVEALEAAVVSDFEKVELVSLDEWQLSITELRVAAVAFLTGQGGADLL